MFITGGPPHTPATGELVAGIDTGDEVAACGVYAIGSRVVRGSALDTGSGVQVGWSRKGVVVGMFREGPSGRFQAPEYNQKTSAATATTRTERKARMIF
jgi:hypothetical protein